MDFTVIVPTHRRPGPLAECLAAITRLDYPHALYEVVVVDDGGGVDLSQALAAGWSPRLLQRPRRGPGAARNAGARVARGRWLAFTDDDCLPDPGWLKALAARLGDDLHLAVGGHTVNHLLDNPFASASQLLIDYLYGHYNRRGGGKARFLTTNNLAVPAATFLALGGFDETYTLAASEDREFCNRWLKQGHRLHYEPAAVVLHGHRLELAGFWRQHVGYGHGAQRYHRARSTLGQDRPPFEPLSFYVNLLRYPWRRRQPDALRLACLLALTQIAHTAGFLKASLQDFCQRTRRWARKTGKGTSRP